jgi:hypothetical protein
MFYEFFIFLVINRNMKKTKILMLSVLVVLSACGKAVETGLDVEGEKVEKKVGKIIEDRHVEEKNIAKEEFGKREHIDLAVTASELGKNSVVDEIVKETDLFSFIKNFPIKTDDYLSCVQSNVMFCQIDAVNQEARRKKTDKPCDYLMDDLSKEECRSQLWMTLAEEEVDVSLCDKIKDISQKVVCRNNIYRSLAMKEHKIEWCDKIKLETTMESNVSIDDGVVVDEVSDNVNYEQVVCKNSVIHQLAFENLDVKFCDKLVGENKEMEQQSCRESVKAEKEMRKEMEVDFSEGSVKMPKESIDVSVSNDVLEDDVPMHEMINSEYEPEINALGLPDAENPPAMD